MVAMQNPQAGNIVLAEPRSLKGGSPPDARGLSTALDPSPLSTPVGSPPIHVLPSPPPSLVPLGAPSHRPKFELHIVPRTPAIDVVEATPANALVSMVGGLRPFVSVAHILLHLSQHYQVAKNEVQVLEFHPFDFLLIFSSVVAADHVCTPRHLGMLHSSWWFSVGVASCTPSSRRSATRCYWHFKCAGTHLVSRCGPGDHWILQPCV
jgi:hypothetical protein